MYTDIQMELDNILKKEKYDMAFESGKLSYTDHEVDLYNSGINQVMSIAAYRGNNIYHFSMEDIIQEGYQPMAKMSLLKLPDSYDGADTEAHKYLHKVGERIVPLSDIHMFFIRGDDIKPDTKGVDILEKAESTSIFLENMKDTLSTCDKYELVRRCPDLPSPITYPADCIEDALSSIKKLPEDQGKFVLKDRFGYGCGAQVHLIDMYDPKLSEKVGKHIEDYKHIIVQEFCPEVANRDIVVTFFDGELIETMQRVPDKGQWKTNASLGGQEKPYKLSPELEDIARSVVKSFSGCRFSSVDMLDSGKVLEINAFPGGTGLYKNYGIKIGSIILDNLEQEAKEKFKLYGINKAV